MNMTKFKDLREGDLVFTETHDNSPTYTIADIRKDNKDFRLKIIDNRDGEYAVGRYTLDTILRDLKFRIISNGVTDWKKVVER